MPPQLRRHLVFSPLYAALIVAACSSQSSSGPTITCGPGTHQVGSECVASEGSGGGGGSTTTASSTSSTTSATSTTSTTTSTTSGTGGGGAGGGNTYVETELTLELAYVAVAPDAGTPDGGPPPTKLVVTARDGTKPVVTDLWLYTLDDMGNKTPLSGFTSTQPRKSPRLMLPATINGQPSGLHPADNGVDNGTMTCSCSRGTLSQGAFVPTVTGTVTITLPATPTTPILVVAGVEDQRYTGAAVINLDGSQGTVPAGTLDLQTHTRVSFSKDVAPILNTNCVLCHTTGGGPFSDAGAGVGPGYNGNFYLVTGTADDLVNGNYALNEATQDCQTSNPDGGLSLDQCIQNITKAQFLVEPGAPAASDLLQRSRPDEKGGTSPQGLLWYGSKGVRYSAKYGDRRMPSTTQSTDPTDWTNAPCYFDTSPADFQVIYDWIAQGAISN